MRCLELIECGRELRKLSISLVQSPSLLLDRDTDSLSLSFRCRSHCCFASSRSRHCLSIRDAVRMRKTSHPTARSRRSRSITADAEVTKNNRRCFAALSMTAESVSEMGAELPIQTTLHGIGATLRGASAGPWFLGFHPGLSSIRPVWDERYPCGWMTAYSSLTQQPTIP
jgi:hypothetical protein